MRLVGARGRPRHFSAEERLLADRRRQGRPIGPGERIRPSAPAGTGLVASDWPGSGERGEGRPGASGASRPGGKGAHKPGDRACRTPAGRAARRQAARRRAARRQAARRQAEHRQVARRPTAQARRIVCWAARRILAAESSHRGQRDCPDPAAHRVRRGPLVRRLDSPVPDPVTVPGSAGRRNRPAKAGGSTRRCAVR